MTRFIPSGEDILYSQELAKKLTGLFKKLLPLNELLEEFVSEANSEKAAAKEEAFAEASMPKAPSDDFMW